MVSPNEIIIHHGNFSWFNNFQFKSFDVWKNDNMSNEIITTYNDESFNNKKRIINDLIKKLPDNVIMYQMEKIIIFIG